MKQITVHFPPQKEVSCPIFVDSGLMDYPKKWLTEKYQGRPLVIITDDAVKSLHGNRLHCLLRSFDPLMLSIREGEHSKIRQTLQQLEEQMFKHCCDRTTVVLALGGGVVGDIAGFLASTYMRGISYIQLPTTLLAMVDSSIGGKTAINTPAGKNLIGSIWQPDQVVIDIKCLNTLNNQQIINGLVEALKMFLISDPDCPDFIQGIINGVLKRETSVLQEVILKSLCIKASIVSEDERENHLRKILNFGHTIGHALEQITDYRLLHGYAVGYGILVESKISQLLGILSSESYQTIQSVFARLDIHGHAIAEYDVEHVIEATKNDKKNISGFPRYVLLEKPGCVYQKSDDTVWAVTDSMVKKAFIEVCGV